MKLAPLLPLAALALLVAAPPANAQDRLKLEQRRRAVLLEAGDRHLDLGLWCRDRGLTTQAAAELVYAVEVSEGQHVGARTVLSYMRSYDDAFWKKYKRGSAASRKSYEIKAAKAREKDAKELLELAGWAWRKTYEKDALDIYVALVRERGAELVFDSKERLVLEHGTVPAEAAAYIRERAVEIEGRLYLQDEFLAALPALSQPLREAAGEVLRVRGPVDADDPDGVARLAELQALGLALLPHLEEVVQARPARRLDVFVFPTRAGFEAWLSENGMGGYAATSGFADGATGTAMICAEGKSDGEVEALVLHELTHLYWYAVTPTAMPDWFGEGFAETFGGQGTFAWDGATLTIGGEMSEHRLAPLRAGAGLFSLRELLDARALDLWNADRERALVFYAQAWALLRWLRTAAPDDLRERFELWVAMCAGSAAGGDSLRSRQRNAQASAALFETTFGADLGAIEQGFRAWLATL